MSEQPDYLKESFIQGFEESIVPWERGCRRGGCMNKEVAFKNLKDFKEVMYKFGVPFLLTFGTLLGAIRDKDFIDHDTDMDVICLGNTQNHYHWKMKQIKKALRKLGFYIADTDECYLKCDYIIRDGEKIEIWWFEKIDNEWIFRADLRYQGRFFDTFDTIKFKGIDFNVPHNPEEFLKLTYGRNWKKKIEKDQDGGIALNQQPSVVEERLQTDYEIEEIQKKITNLETELNQLKINLKHLEELP